MQPACSSHTAAWSSAAITEGCTPGPGARLNSATFKGLAEGGYCSGAGTHSGSRASPWAITRNASRASATVRVSGPCTDISWLVMVRSSLAVALTAGTRPAVVRRPTTPQAHAG
jgi:hypothetical protein